MNAELFTIDFVCVLLWLVAGKPLIIGLFTLLINVPPFKSRRVFQLDLSSGQTGRELKAAWVVITDAVVLALYAALGWIQLGTNTPINTLLTFGLFFVWVELWFYWTHRWMHQSRWLWPAHAAHHLSKINQPLTATSFSVIEKLIFYSLGWFLLPVLVSWWYPISPYGIALYFTVYYIASCIAHSNTEFSYTTQKHLPWGLDKLPGSGTGHAIHHARYNVNFGLLTTILDRLLGTYASDTVKVQAKAADGGGLTQLHEVLP